MAHFEWGGPQLSCENEHGKNDGVGRTHYSIDKPRPISLSLSDQSSGVFSGPVMYYRHTPVLHNRTAR